MNFILGHKSEKKSVNDINFVRPGRFIMTSNDALSASSNVGVSEIKTHRITSVSTGISDDNGNGVTSYLFSGIDAYLEIPDSPDWDVVGSSEDNWTLSLFVKWSKYPVDSDSFFSQSESNSNRWQFYHNSSAGIIFIVKSGGDNILNLVGGSYIADTNWHHVAMCKVADEYGCYIDGIQQNYVKSASTDTFAATLGIGDLIYVSGDSFPGYMDEMLIEQSNVFRASPNVGVTDTITVPTAPFSKNTNTKLLIHCDETITSGATGSGKVFTDATGNHVVTENVNAIRERQNVTTYANRITSVSAGISEDNGNGVTSYLLGSIDYYLVDGIEDYLEIPDSPDWDVVGSSEDNWTLSLFVKWSKYPVGSDSFFSQSESNSDRWQFYHNSPAGIKFIVVSGGDSILDLEGGSYIADTNWHHIALCKVADEYGCYIDGIQQNYIQSTSTDTFAATLGIGDLIDVTGDSFPGYMDEMLIEQSNVFRASPNVGVTDTITVPTAPFSKNTNTKLLIHCDETITSGTTGSGAVFTDATGNHVVTENANAIREKLH